MRELCVYEAQVVDVLTSQRFATPKTFRFLGVMILFMDIWQDLEQGSALHEVSAYNSQHKRRKMQICIALMEQGLTFAVFEQWKTTLVVQPE